MEEGTDKDRRVRTLSQRYRWCCRDRGWRPGLASGGETGQAGNWDTRRPACGAAGAQPSRRLATRPPALPRSARHTRGDESDASFDLLLVKPTPPKRESGGHAHRKPFPRLISAEESAETSLGGRPRRCHPRHASPGTYALSIVLFFKQQ